MKSPGLKKEQTIRRKKIVNYAQFTGPVSERALHHI